MALRNYNTVQGVDRRGTAYTHKSGRGDQSPDVEEFLIEALDAQSGSVKESLTLQGTHKPFQPFTHPVKQEVVSYYYPGGQANRVPTVQVLGSMDDPITFRGWFRASKIQDVGRRNEPLEISSIIERLIREGNVCRFTLGSWSKYGVLVEFRPDYRDDAWVDWSLQVLVIGDKNPITGEEVVGESAVGRVFGTDVADDFSQVIGSLSQEIVATKDSLEASGYIQRHSVVPFSISGYLGRLVEGGAVGELVDFGRSVYEGWVDIMRSVNAVTTSLVEFSEDVDRTASGIQQQVQLVLGQISNIYRVQDNLYNAISRVSSSVGTFERLLAWNTLGDMISYTHTLQGHYLDIKHSLDREEARTFRQVYFTKDGDTLQGISSRFFGSFDRWEELGELNNIEVGEDIPTDTLLIIPN